MAGLSCHVRKFWLKIPLLEMMERPRLISWSADLGMPECLATCEYSSILWKMEVTCWEPLRVKAWMVLRFVELMGIDEAKQIEKFLEHQWDGAEKWYGWLALSYVSLTRPTETILVFLTRKI